MQVENKYIEENAKIIRVAQVMGKWVGGGVEAVVMNYYRNIDKSKVQFDFLFDEDSKDIPIEEIKALGGRIFIVPPYQRVFKYQKELIKIFKLNNYKIIHSHINNLSVFPLRAAYKAGIPVRIAHSHSTSNKKEWKKNMIKSLLKPFSKKYSTEYFSCTEMAGRYLFGDRTFENDEVKIINNAIDLEKFNYDYEIRKNKRKELGINDDVLVIGNIGRFVDQKNHDFLIDIFKDINLKNKNSILLLIGDGPLRKKIEEKVFKLGLKEKVVFLGNRNDVNELYQAMDTFLFPSLYEGLGMVLIEAQTSGLYCVASTKVPKDTEVTKNIGFISLDKSSKEWADYVLKIRGDRRSYNSEITEKGYNIKYMAKNLEKIYIEYDDDSKIKVLQCGMTDNLGGIETFLMNYYKNINRDNVKFDFTNIYSNKLCFQDEIEKLGGKVFKLESYYRHPIKYIKKLKKIIKDNKYDIVHCNMNSAVMIYPLIAAKLSGCKTVIAHSHNAASDKGVIKDVLHNINKHLIPIFANEYFACSEKAGEWFYSDKIRKGKNYQVIYNAIDLDKFRFDKNVRIDIREEFKISDDTLLLGHVGRFNKQKNHEFIIDLFEDLYKDNKNIKLILIGIGPLQDTIKKKVEELNLSENIIFAGKRLDVERIYQGIDVFLLPSLYEGLPLVGVEAQASGSYCIFSNEITKEVKCNENTSFIELDIHQWYKEISRLYLNKKNRNDVLEVNKLQQFDIQVATNLLEQIYFDKIRKENK